MKKKIIYSSLLTALLSASSCALAGGPEIIPLPDYFSGMYVGGIGGVHHNTFNGNSQVVLTQPSTAIGIIGLLPIAGIPAGTLYNSDIGGGEYDGFGGIQGGFGKVINQQFYVGIQGWGEWGSSSETDNQFASVPFTPINLIAVVITPVANASTSTTTKINNDYGVAAKLGWVVAPRSMIYGKIGASWADIEVDNSLNALASLDVSSPVIGTIINATTTAGTSSSSESTKLGLLLGIGFEQFVYQDIVSINVEGTYTNYGQVSSNGQVSGNTSLSILPALLPVLPTLNFPFTTNVFSGANTNVQVSTLMAGVNFYFGRSWL